MDLATLMLELANIAADRADKQLKVLDDVAAESAKLAKPADEEVPEAKTDEEARKELADLKSRAKAAKKDLEAAAKVAAEKAADVEDQVKPEDKIIAEHKAALADLEAEGAKRDFQKAQRMVETFIKEQKESKANQAK